MEAVSKRQVLTGPGGSGKSYVLAQLHAEATGPRAWIDAQVTAGLEEALSFGASACSVRQEPLTVFVEALDSAASPGELLATIERALAGRDASVVVAARHTTWAEVRDRFPGWKETPLAGWSPERVRQLTDRNRPVPLSPDLVELLRTPLLLDLFLRAFGPTEQIPSGLATRHGVLRSYFERRVLASPRDAAQRRAALERGASEVLSNKGRWLDPSTAAGQLVGEGVLVLNYGELAFRHALLRDFAVSLALGRHDAADIANRLALVTNPAIRNDLLRGVLEARMDPAFADAPGPSVESIVRACAAQRLSPGIAIGSSDAPTAELVAMLGPLEAGTTFQQALDRARLVDNRIWIRVIASIGGARPPWLGDVQIDALSRLAQHALETHDPGREALARTLRDWTTGQVGDTWEMMRILKLVVRTLPDDETLAWIASLRMRAVVTTGELLNDLRHMLISRPGLDADLARRALMNLVFEPGSSDAANNHRRWALVHRCLLSDGPKKPGLVSKRPEIALPIVFELGAREAEKQKRRRDEELATPEFREAFAKLAESAPPRPQNLEEDAARLRRLPVLTEEEALGGLIDDAPWFSSHRMDDMGRLFNAAANLTHQSATVPPLVTAAKGSRSIRARLLVLDRRSAASPDAVWEVLADPRVYHSVRAQRVIHDALARHWSAFPPEAREEIQRNILNVASSPVLRVTAVGNLAAAIPRSELDPELVPYLDFSEQEQHTLRPDVPSAQRSLHGEREPDEAERAPAGMKRNEAFARLQESIKARSSREAQRILSEIVDRGLLNEADHDAWIWISNVLEHDEAQESSSLSGACTRAVFNAALSRARSAGGREISFWSTLIAAAENAAAHVEHQADPAMGTELFAEITAAAGQEAENREHAEHALSVVRSWSRPDSPGRELFLRWFRESLGAEALEHALHHLPYFGLDTRIELVTRVMETAGRLKPDVPHLRELASGIGGAVATWCMWIPDSAARDMFDRWRAQRPGLLADGGVWRALIDGFSWSLMRGLREAPTVEDAGRRDFAIEQYTSLATAAWQAWPPPTEADHEAIAWALLSPLVADFEGPERPWSYTLRPLLLSILAEACRVDLLAALQGLEWSRLDEETLVAAGTAMLERAQRSGEDRLAVLALIEALEGAGSLRTLPVSMAYKVLDGLQTLGGRFPRATVAARSVERRILLDGA